MKSATGKIDALRKSSDKGSGEHNPESKTEAEGIAPAEGSAVSAKSRIADDIYTDPEYGTVLVGQNELVQAVIKFNYILYVGEMLGKKKD